MRVLRQRDFALAWTGGLVSMIGSWALWIALPIHVYEQTGSALATSGVVAAVVAPGVLFGSFAGVFVDRWDRKSTLVLTNLVQVAVTLALLGAVEESRLWLVYPVIAVSAVVSQFMLPAENAFLPRLVAERDLMAANSLNAFNNNLARLAGPAAGGGLVAAFGLTGVVLVDAVTYVVAALLIGLVRTSGAVEAAGEATTAAVRRWRRVWREWRDGLGVVASERAVAVVFAVTALTAIGEGVFSVMFVVWVRDVLEGGAPALGALQTSQAVGGLIGGLVGGYVGTRLAAERLFGLALLVFGALDLLLFNYPLLLDGLSVGMGLMVLVGIPTVSSQASRQTILQTHVADAYRGRVFGSLGTTSSLLMLVGTVTAGAVGGLLGPIALLNVQGGAYVVAGAVALVALRSAGRSGQPALTRAR